MAGTALNILWSDVREEERIQSAKVFRTEISALLLLGIIVQFVV